MAVSNQRLMEMAPDAAVVQMFADANRTPLEPTAVRHARLNVESSDGRSGVTDIRLMEGEVFIDGELTDFSVEFNFNRVDVATRLAGVADSWHPTLPISTQDLLDHITEKTGQKFYLEDFILETIASENARPYVLKAKSESMRWHGSLEVTLSDDTTLAYVASQELVPHEDTFTLGQVDFQRTLWRPEIYYGEIDVTDSKSVIDDIPVGAFAQNRLGLLVMVNAYCGNPLYLPGYQSGQWVQSLIPHPFNLFNSRVIEHGVVDGRTVFRLQIDTNYCTNFESGFIDFYYREDD